MAYREKGLVKSQSTSSDNRLRPRETSYLSPPESKYAAQPALTISVVDGRVAAGVDAVGGRWSTYTSWVCRDRRGSSAGEAPGFNGN